MKFLEMEKIGDLAVFLGVWECKAGNFGPL